jgi:cytochrome c-type biogenesis protein CcmF
MVVADVDVYRNGAFVGAIRPRKDFFGVNDNPMTIAGQYSTLESDFYVLLTNWEGNLVTFKIYLNPLINLIWWGGVILMLGTSIAAWPSPERDALRAAESAEATVLGHLQGAGD